MQLGNVLVANWRRSAGPASWSEHLFDVFDCGPQPSAAELRRVEIGRQVEESLQLLRLRSRERTYPDTNSVLVFYWLETLRERFMAEHWSVLENQTQEMLRSPNLRQEESQALARALEWIPIAWPGGKKARRAADSVAPFTSGHLAPPAFICQAFLEELLNTWLPERMLEKYGKNPLLPEWSAEDAYQEAASCLEEILRPWAALPSYERLRALDKMQRRIPAQSEDLRLWERKRQAALESLVRVALSDASRVDPKLREILNDVILYLLGRLEPAPLPEPGYAWLLPSFLGSNLPRDLAEQVCAYPLPANYARETSLFIPLRTRPAPPSSSEKVRAFSINSAILTPDGRVWEAHHMEQEAGAAPGIVYFPIGKIEVLPSAEGSFLKLPVATWPPEITPEMSQATELELFHRKWRIHHINGSAAGLIFTYKSMPPGSRPTLTPDADSPQSQREGEPPVWRKAS